MLTARLKVTFGLKWLRHRKTISWIFAVPDLQMEMEALHCFVFVFVSSSSPVLGLQRKIPTAHVIMTACH
ncbi:hypothetical protein R3I94_001066 [Phoxinus phoxinus]